MLPFYNEVANAGPVLGDAVRVMRGLSGDYEIIAVNDGSVDGTGGVLEGLAEKNRRIKPLHHKGNSGYGQALRTGIAAARGDWIFISDGDGQYSLDEFKEFIPHLRDYPVVLGYRINRRDPWFRKFNSSIYNLAARVSLGVRLRDINCAMKVFHRSVIKDLRFRTTGLIIYFDILSQILAKGARFKELGVTHRPRLAGTPTGARPDAVLTAMKEFLKIFPEEFLRMVLRARTRDPEC